MSLLACVPQFYARSVVHDDTTDDGAFYGGRVGVISSSVIHLPLSDDTGLQGDFFVVGTDVLAFPMFAGYKYRS